MIKLACFALICAVAPAQIASLGANSVTPHAEEKPSARSKSIPAAGRPIAGYIIGPGSLQLHSLLTIGGSVKLGNLISTPEGTSHVYLPPGQQYALIEQATYAQLCIWALHRAATTNTEQELVPIVSSIPHPDLAAFSPRGESAVLYSHQTDEIQILTHLPAEPQLKTVPLPIGIARKLAVTDDAAIVVAELEGGTTVYSANGQSWKPVLAGFTPRAWTFLAKSHDLAIADPNQNQVVVLNNLDITSGRNYRTVVQNLNADFLSSTRAGETLVAANLAVGQVWTIDVKTDAATLLDESGPIQNMVSLHDGYTFVISDSTNLSVLRLRASPLTTTANR